MTSPEALAILAKPEYIAAVADLLRERDDLRAALKSAQAEIEMHDRSAQRAARIDRMEPTDGDRKWAVVAHVELVRHLAQLLILSMETAGAINYTEHTVTGTLDVGEIRITATTLLPGGRTPDKLREQAAMERDEASAERDRLLSVLRDVSEALSGGEVPAENLARTVAVVMHSNAAHLERVTKERDEARNLSAQLDELAAFRREMLATVKDGRAYVPQENAAEMLVALDRAGVATDQGNTLWALVHRVIQERNEARAEVKRLTAERDFYCDRALHLLDNHMHGADRDAEYSRLERGPEVPRG